MFTLFLWICLFVLGLAIYFAPVFLNRRMYEGFEEEIDTKEYLKKLKEVIQPQVSGTPELSSPDGAETTRSRPSPANPPTTKSDLLAQGKAFKKNIPKSTSKPSRKQKKDAKPSRKLKQDAKPSLKPSPKKQASKPSLKPSPKKQAPEPSLKPSPKKQAPEPSRKPSPKMQAPKPSPKKLVPEPSPKPIAKSEPAPSNLRPRPSLVLAQGAAYKKTIPAPIPAPIQKVKTVPANSAVGLVSSSIPPICPPPKIKYVKVPNTCPDMSQYIRKDSIPCWSCKLG